MNNHKPSDKYRDRLTRNAEDFDSIVSGLLDELDSMAAWEQAKALKEEARDELHGMATNNHKELRERLRGIVDGMRAPNTSIHWYDSVSKLTEVSEEEFSALLDLIDRLEADAAHVRQANANYRQELEILQRENEELRKDAERGSDQCCKAGNTLTLTLTYGDLKTTWKEEG